MMQFHTHGLTCAMVGLAMTGAAGAETLLFDFGNTGRQTSPGWNNVVPATTTLFATFDSNNNLTPVGFEITDTFFQTGEPSQLGTESPSGDAAGYPVDATDDYFFGHVTAFAGADPNPYGEVKLFNLDPNSTYNFTFFGSRMGVSDIRDASYTVTGTNSLNGVLNASNNESEVLRLNGIAPDGNNEIFIGVAPGPNNSNGVGFYYINLVQVDRVIPEPASVGLLGLGGLALLRRRVA
ncbi:MAG: PEP-CTERM sorting domain-containing protein [Phycisphaeraceae bacterium]